MSAQRPLPTTTPSGVFTLVGAVATVGLSVFVWVGLLSYYTNAPMHTDFATDFAVFAIAGAAIGMSLCWVFSLVWRPFGWSSIGLTVVGGALGVALGLSLTNQAVRQFAMWGSWYHILGLLCVLTGLGGLIAGAGLALALQRAQPLLTAAERAGIAAAWGIGFLLFWPLLFVDSSMAWAFCGTPIISLICFGLAIGVSFWMLHRAQARAVEAAQRPIIHIDGQPLQVVDDAHLPDARKPKRKPKAADARTMRMAAVAILTTVFVGTLASRLTTTGQVYIVVTPTFAPTDGLTGAILDVLYEDAATRAALTPLSPTAYPTGRYEHTWNRNIPLELIEPVGDYPAGTRVKISSFQPALEGQPYIVITEAGHQFYAREDQLRPVATALQAQFAVPPTAVYTTDGRDWPQLQLARPAAGFPAGEPVWLTNAEYNLWRWIYTVHTADYTTLMLSDADLVPFAPTATPTAAR